MKIFLKPLWRKYVGLCIRHPDFAPPMPQNFGLAGWKWCHPAYFRHEWSRDEDGTLRTLHRLLRPGDDFYDVGANIGVIALVASHRVDKSGRVIAFEPAAANLCMLRYHLKWNRAANVRVEPTCVGAACGETVFSLLEDGLSTGNSLTFSRKSDPAFVREKFQNVSVPVTTLDAYWRQSGITPRVIKIDVEGAEYDVLAGARQLLADHRPALLIGVHPFWWPDGQPPHAITEFLSEYEYDVFTVNGEKAVPETYADFLCLPRQGMSRVAESVFAHG